MECPYGYIVNNDYVEFMVSLIEENNIYIYIYRVTLQEIVDQIRVRFELLYFEVCFSNLKFTILILKFTIPF